MEENENKENMAFSIDVNLGIEFRKKCIDNGVSYSEAITQLMKEYIKRK